MHDVYGGEVVAVEAAPSDVFGNVMKCTSLTGSSYHYLVEPGEAAAPPPDPRQVAQTAISRMDLAAPRIGSFPWTVERSRESMGIVGWNVWLWVAEPSPATFGPITKSATAGGYTVTATAQVTSVTWEMGNGDVVQCDRGTPYPLHPGQPDPKSPDCGYVYTKDGDYTITATANWEITWSGIGQSGTIPMELTSSGNLAIAEIQVVNVSNRDR